MHVDDEVAFFPLLFGIYLISLIAGWFTYAHGGRALLCALVTTTLSP